MFSFLLPVYSISPPLTICLFGYTIIIPLLILISLFSPLNEYTLKYWLSILFLYNVVVMINAIIEIIIKPILNCFFILYHSPFQFHVKLLI